MSADSANMPSARFRTTRWSLVLAAQEPDNPDAVEALATLCAGYWYPLYAFIRRQGHGPEDARDLTQEFFARLLEKDYLAVVDRARGRFRSFLLTACRHFLANEHDRATTQKRGGGVVPLSLDFLEAEKQYGREPLHEMTAEKLFERRWALTLLNQVLDRLRQEFEQADKLRVFDQLKGALAGEGDGARYADLGCALDLSESAVKVAVHRLRKRYRELLQEEIARTVHDPREIEEEIRSLFTALRL